ncbi:MAG: transposase [Bacteroidia bacterium]|nr:transposase [Bacteroidia bacterium]
MKTSQIKRKFNTQAKCLKYLEKLRWHNKPVCIFCNAQNITKRKNTIKYHCNKCNRDFSVLQGTIFENTHLPLTKWFQVILLVLNNGTELSTLQISKKINVSYKTTWYTVVRIRNALKARANTAHN